MFGITCTSTTHCVAAGYGGAIFTTSNGTTWTQSTPVTPNSLQDVSCSAATICYAVGDSGTTLSTNNGGIGWTVQPSSTAKYLTSIDCHFNCYAGTSDGSILTEQAGSFWTQVAQVDTSLGGMSCAGVGLDYRCMAVGDGGTILSARFQHNSGGGGGGGHCGTPSNPCKQ